MGCGVGRRQGSDLALPWLWCRSLAREPPYAVGTALKRQKTKGKKSTLEIIKQSAELLLLSIIKQSTFKLWLKM